MRKVAPGAKLRVLLTHLSAAPVPTAAFGERYHPRWRIEAVFKRLKHRRHLEASSGLSQHALLVDVAAKVLADKISRADMPGCAGRPRTAGAPAMPSTQAGAVVQRLLPRVLLAVGDVPGMINSAMTVIARTLHRITPGRSAPRKADQIKPHVRLAYTG